MKSRSWNWRPGVLGLALGRWVCLALYLCRKATVRPFLQRVSSSTGCYKTFASSPRLTAGVLLASLLGSSSFHRWDDPRLIRGHGILQYNTITAHENMYVGSTFCTNNLMIDRMGAIKDLSQLIASLSRSFSASSRLLTLTRLVPRVTRS
jgi:hypothetical protein